MWAKRQGNHHIYYVHMALSFAELGLPEQAVGFFPLGLGFVMEDRPTELSRNFKWSHHAAWGAKNG